jgi:hypothetical protein
MPKATDKYTIPRKPGVKHPTPHLVVVTDAMVARSAAVRAAMEAADMSMEDRIYDLIRHLRAQRRRSHAQPVVQPPSREHVWAQKVVTLAEYRGARA